jgi:hypothetical protein
MAKRRIRIEFALTATGAYCVASDLAALNVTWQWLLRELNRLSDDDILALFSEDDGKTAGPEGRWGLLDLDPYWLICQLRLTEPYTWRMGSGEGWLKIIRMHRRRGPEAAISEMRRLEEEAEQRSRGGERA